MPCHNSSLQDLDGKDPKLYPKPNPDPGPQSVGFYFLRTRYGIMTDKI
jgi:hypothetical protein